MMLPQDSEKCCRCITESNQKRELITMLKVNQIKQEMAALYGINAEELTQYAHHEGGRNTVFRYGDMVIRVSGANDRRYGDYLAEAEYVHYLALGGTDTVDVIPSVNGRLVERIDNLFVSAFTLAKGD